jgi:hypothetical protein
MLLPILDRRGHVATTSRPRPGDGTVAAPLRVTAFTLNPSQLV